MHCPFFSVAVTFPHMKITLFERKMIQTLLLNYIEYSRASDIQHCCIQHGPGRECIVDVIGGGGGCQSLNLRLRWGVLVGCTHLQ
jgi:hypothetical protein